MLYRIYTEYRPNIAAIVEKHFDGFTMLAPAVGYWKGKAEHTQIVEIALDGNAFASAERIGRCAAEIRLTNKQEAVLVVSIQATETIIKAGGGK